MITNGNITIARIEAENFLLISKMDYTPRPGLNVFVGANSQGKTDILRLLKAIFKGAGIETISHGKDKNSFMARLSNGDEIRRVITEKSKRFQVKTELGDFKASPQAYLDALLGDSDLSFDPISFVLKDPKQQKQMLLETFNIGKIEPTALSAFLEPEILNRLDFTKPALDVLKDAENIIYTKRSEINKDVARLKTLYEDTVAKVKYVNPESETYNPPASIQTDIDNKERELAEAKAFTKQVEGTQALLNRLNGSILTAEKELESIDSKLIDNIPFYEQAIIDTTKEIQELQKKLKELQEVVNKAIDIRRSKKELIQSIEENRTTIKQLPSTDNIPNISEIGKQLATLKLEFEYSNIYVQAENFKDNHDKLKEQADGLTTILDKLRKDLPEQIMKNTNIPFKSLTFEGDEVVIDGNRLSLMATSEQLLTTLQIYKERNKNARLKVVCCDRIEVLDDQSYETFWRFCIENGLQAFCTKVISSKLPEDAIMIEHGELIEK